MNKSRFVLALVFIGALLLSTVAIVSGGQDKVDVCHITGTYDFGSGEVPIGHVINVADPAYQSHLDHGDPSHWTIVTLPDGSEVCTARFKVVFATSTTHTGALGGLEGADNTCNTLASNAGLTGNFKAWLSDCTNSPDSRFVKHNCPYVLPDATGQYIHIAENWADLTDGQLLHPIDRDEYGNPVNSTGVWTATDASGLLQLAYNRQCYRSSCQLWNFVNDTTTPHPTAIYGDIRSATYDWTGVHYSCCPTCDDLFNLYCFEQ